MLHNVLVNFLFVYTRGRGATDTDMARLCQNDSPCQKTAKKALFCPNLAKFRVLLPQRWVKLSIFWAFVHSKGKVTDTEALTPTAL